MKKAKGKNKRIKPCFISLNTHFLLNKKTKKPVGGAEVQSYQLSRALSKEFDVSFITGDFHQKEIENIDELTVYKYSDKPGLFKRIKFIRVIPVMTQLFKLMKKIDADIYIQRSSGFMTFEIALFCKLLGKKFVFMTSHEKCCNPDKFKHLGRITPFYKLGIKGADLVIVQNKEHKRLIKKKLRVDSVVIKNAFEIRYKKRKKDIILWVARLLPWKQPELFLKLAKEFPKEKFVMVGQGKNKHIIKEANKIKNLELIQYVPFDEINGYFQRAKIFVNTSTAEGFPNTFIQAWASMTPIISLNIDPDEIICEKKLGFHSYTFSQMKRDLKTLLENKKEYDRFVKKGYKYVRENHDIKIIVKKLAKLLTEVKNA